MVTVGAVMNQATPTPVWICSGVTPVARRVHQTLSISVSLLPHLLITPIHVDLVSIPWTSVVHSQLCLCITLSYSFLQRCSFLYLGPASPLLFQEVFPEHLTCIFHVFSFVVSLFSCAIYCLLIVTQGPSKRRHIQIGQFERNLIKGPFTKVSRVGGECSPLRWVTLLPAVGQIANICWIIEKTREFQKNIYFCFID